MKFAHEFKEALGREGYPAHWIDSAIPYSQLKKCLKKVQQELRGLGLEPETLQQLLAAHAVSAEGDTVPVAKYNLDASGSHMLRPRLSFFVQLKDGVVVDAALSPASRAFLQKFAAARGTFPSVAQGLGVQPGTNLSDHGLNEPSSMVNAYLNKCSLASAQPGDTGGQPHRVEVPLVFDSEFFDILQNDVTGLDALQRQEQRIMKADITDLGRDISTVTRPSRFAKTDLSRWRELFELYVHAQVFFSTQEREHGPRRSGKALKQLVWFQKEINDRKLAEHFKLSASRDAYSRFLKLNATLLQNLKFQEINQTAITKILKKFDKRTSLGVSRTFPTVINSRAFIAESVAKDICAVVTQELITVVPRFEDYMCPICLSIAWLPRELKRQCPLCREGVVLEADLSNLDRDLEKFLRRYFRKETSEKQRANEIERGIELYGEAYEHSSCTVM
ncbi:Transcriptional regulator [Pleurostoma richardsiae]|uniref:Transcriptional regulator n=1 Tax=Pleurostoma richardsiae TaxID=41990 RepID=A0AA38R5X8_9PEZI|nr:Transcriptional regulator [Pleurostoma richardsiae]